MVDEPEVPGRHPIFDNGGSVDRSIVPVKEPLSGRHIRSLLLESRQEFAQGLHNEVRVDRLDLGNVICIYEPLVEKRQDHLFAFCRMDLGLYWPRLSFFGPLIRLHLGLRRMKTHSGLVHHHYGVQHRHCAAVNHCQKLFAGPDPLLLVSACQQLLESGPT